jgi:hypothetical protein
VSTLAQRTAITLDIDWAPDFVIESVAETLLGRGVAATWFVTHSSPAIDALRAHPDVFELGIHPNFAPGSTHGSTPEMVLEHCLELVPEARSMRTHGLVQSSALLALVRQHTPIDIDLSLFLPHASHAGPIEYPLQTGSLLRIPYIWEDDAEMYSSQPSWSTSEFAKAATGLAVFNFHPVHICLNSATLEPYGRLKARAYPDVGPHDVAEVRTQGPGTATAFAELVNLLSGTGARRVGDLADTHRTTPEWPAR